ncbi:hypothetical protein pb186bvf_000543 [Paramecium bursaria]
MKQLLRNTLEEQQRIKQQSLMEYKLKNLEHEQNLVSEQQKAFEFDQYQRKIQQKEKQRELQQAYNQSIQYKQEQITAQKMQKIYDEQDLVSQAQQYQEMQKQQKIQQQQAMKAIADAQLTHQNRKKQIEYDLIQQDKFQNQKNQQEYENRVLQKQQQYQDYYKQVSINQDRLQRQFADSIQNREKQQMIENHINKGIEDVQRRETIDYYNRNLQKEQNKQHMREVLQQQIREKEISNKKFDDDIMSRKRDDYYGQITKNSDGLA